MADQRIIDLAPQTVPADTDLYENSKNGTGSQKETRLQMRNAMQAVFDLRYLGGNSPANIIAWSSPAGPTQMVSGNGYTTTNALAFQVFTMPIAPAQGDIVIVHGYANGGFEVDMGTASMLRIGNQLAVANIQSRSQWDSISFRCVSAATGGQWKGEAIQSAGFIIN